MNRLGPATRFYPLNYATEILLVFDGLQHLA